MNKKYIKLTLITMAVSIVLGLAMGYGVFVVIAKMLGVL
jgi:hypothetical protein